MFFSFFLLFFTGNSQAFTLVTSNMVGWPKNEVKFHLNSSQCDISASAVKSAVNAAIDLWNSVPTSALKVSLESDTSGTGLSGEPIIECSTSFSSSGVVGTGSTSSVGGVIQSANILLNANSSLSGDINSINATQLNVVLAHEMGHVLGLGHSPSEAALMYYSIGEKTNLALSQDDMDGVSFLYPRQESLGTKAFGCGTLIASNLNDEGGSPPFFMLGLCLFSTLLLRIYLIWRKINLRRN